MLHRKIRIAVKTSENKENSTSFSIMAAIFSSTASEIARLITLMEALMHFLFEVERVVYCIFANGNLITRHFSSNRRILRLVHETILEARGGNEAMKDCEVLYSKIHIIQ